MLGLLKPQAKADGGVAAAAVGLLWPNAGQLWAKQFSQTGLLESATSCKLEMALHTFCLRI